MKKTEAGKVAEEPLILLPQAAFIIQLGVGAEIGSGRIPGRIEHFASGKSARIHTPDELFAFMTWALAIAGPDARERE